MIWYFGIPLLSILWVLFRKNKEKEQQKREVLWLIGGIFFYTIYWLLTYHEGIEGWQKTEQFELGINFSITLSIDGISLSLIWLTSLLLPICLISSWKNIHYIHTEFLVCLLLTQWTLYNSFLIINILGFYVFFESTLIPIFWIIGIWGNRTEKIQAAYYFLFYTIVGSIFILFSLFYLYTEYGTLDYYYLLKIINSNENFIEKFLWIGFFLAIIIKLPIIPFHIWLPQAHVEAPVAGSVLLAGILLKLGSYGILRFILPLFSFSTTYFLPFLFILCIVTIIYSTLTTLRQNDLKRLVAYSSISHISLITLGIFSFTLIGLEGGIIIILAHGLISSGLFLIVGFLYDRFHSRLIPYYGGLTLLIPLWSLCFFLLSLGNLSIPLSLNFISEFFIFLGLFSINKLSSLFACLSIIGSASYSLFAYIRLAFGPLSPYLQYIMILDLNKREISLIWPLIGFTLLFGLFPTSWIQIFEFSLKIILLC